MNTYQKVLVCIFRTIGVLLLGYASVALVMGLLLMNSMAGFALVASLPILGIGLLSYFAAVPFARIITIGIDE